MAAVVKGGSWQADGLSEESKVHENHPPTAGQSSLRDHQCQIKALAWLLCFLEMSMNYLLLYFEAHALRLHVVE